ncbi:MAG TPA: hypothetical protein VE172_09665 [Stackebrandtia sp.]|jgi:hypothetical protein|uniref:hypothetical protein n=1 Tax=Stackebrandtia sp. TaxID=2023065 RepID=UPI002D264522|nr:hypothetical protein [Stackebrandtia sp.]HZE39063.1 hypothetical protein [Stackebrandtia sp.]
MTDDHKSSHQADEADDQPEPTNRAERRALKKNKGKNQAKGVNPGSTGNGFHPKDVKVAGHKEFTNRKSG